MNLLGKIFVVLILLMSLTFMGFAFAVYATHQNWERAVNRTATERQGGEPLGLRFQLEEATLQRDQKEAQIKQLRDELDLERSAKRAALARLQTENTKLKKDNDDLTNEINNLVQREREAVAAMQAAQQTLAAKREEVAKLRSDIRTAQQARDDQFNQYVKLTDDFNQTKNELERLKAQTVTLADQVAKYRDVLSRLNVNPETPPGTIAPQLDGIVLASGKDGLVEISLGSDDGLQRGHTLEVYRGGRYLGRIEVFQTAPDKSVAKILPQFRKGPIEKEDRVATRFN